MIKRLINFPNHGYTFSVPYCSIVVNVCKFLVFLLMQRTVCVMPQHTLKIIIWSMNENKPLLRVNKNSWGFVPSILQDRSTLQSHGDTLLHSDMDISPHTVAHVYLEDRGLHSYDEKENCQVNICPLLKVINGSLIFFF